jgi:hypothetical protein
MKMTIKSVPIIALCGLLALGASARAEYYDQPRELEITGPYTQAPTGMVFPESVAGFKRTGIVSYNSERTEESVDYFLDGPGKQIAVTVYVYPVPAELGELAKALSGNDLVQAWDMLGEQLYSDEQQAIVELHPGADVVQEGATTFEQHGVSHPGALSVFRYDEDFFGRTVPVESRLYLFPMVAGKWMVKYRITFPEAVDAASDVNAFIHALPWTIGGLK